MEMIQKHRGITITKVLRTFAGLETSESKFQKVKYPLEALYSRGNYLQLTNFVFDSAEKL